MKMKSEQLVRERKREKGFLPFISFAHYRHREGCQKFANYERIAHCGKVIFHFHFPSLCSFTLYFYFIGIKLPSTETQWNGNNALYSHCTCAVLLGETVVAVGHCRGAKAIVNGNI